MLTTKTMTELRGIAQSLSVGDMFKKTRAQLLQAIELKQGALAPAERIELPRNQYDARLMTEEPGKMGDRQEIEGLLAPYVARGLLLSFTEEKWFMQRGKKTNEGTMRMPLRHVLRCAEAMMK